MKDTRISRIGRARPVLSSTVVTILSCIMQGEAHFPQHRDLPLENIEMHQDKYEVPEGKFLQVNLRDIMGLCQDSQNVTPYECPKALFLDCLQVHPGILVERHKNKQD